MQTLVRKISERGLESAASQSALALAAEVIQRGDLVAFPTETVYGLGADALNPAAVERIFIAKQRPHWDPLIVHIAGWTMLEQVAYEVSERARALMAAFWPGPLTLLLPRGDRIAAIVTASRPLVAVRWPAHPIAQALIARADTPLAAPSANLFNHVSPTTAQHVLADLDGRIAMVLDGGAATLGLESCVVDPNEEPAVVYRPGSITVAQLEAVIGAVRMYQPDVFDVPKDSAPSPGTGSRHYAPRARLLLVSTQEELMQAAGAQGIRVGVMLPEGWQAPASAVVFQWGKFSDAVALGQNLYSGLRWLDAQNVSTILCPMPDENDATRALRDRLMRAAK
jgi:L-threonylcarbamoyladenylate synthase